MSSTPEHAIASLPTTIVDPPAKNEKQILNIIKMSTAKDIPLLRNFLELYQNEKEEARKKGHDVFFPFDAMQAFFNKFLKEVPDNYYPVQHFLINPLVGIYFILDVEKNPIGISVLFDIEADGYTYLSLAFLPSKTNLGYGGVFTKQFWEHIKQYTNIPINNASQEPIRFKGIYASVNIVNTSSIIMMAKFSASVYDYKHQMNHEREVSHYIYFSHPDERWSPSDKIDPDDFDVSPAVKKRIMPKIKDCIKDLVDKKTRDESLKVFNTLTFEPYERHKKRISSYQDLIKDVLNKFLPIQQDRKGDNLPSCLPLIFSYFTQDIRCEFDLPAMLNKETQSLLLRKGEDLLSAHLLEKKIEKIYNPFLYKLQKSGKTFYILGSAHHIFYKELPKSVKELLPSIKTLLVEPIEDPFIREVGVAKSIYEAAKEPNPENSALRTLDINVQKELVESYGDRIFEFQPWGIIYLYLTYGLFKSKPEFELEDAAKKENLATVPTNPTANINVFQSDPRDSLIIDAAIKDYFEKENKGTTIGLETQLDVVEARRIPPTTIVDLLNLVTVNEVVDEEIKVVCKRFVNQVESTVNSSYRIGDAVPMQDISEVEDIAHQLEKYPVGESSHESQINRNMRWFPKIITTLTDKKNSDPILIVVGCMHLFGKNGLLKLFKNQDYQIERILSDENIKKQVFLLAYHFAKLTGINWMNVQLIIDYVLYPEKTLNETISTTVKQSLPLDINPELEETWELQVNPAMTLWAYNTHRRLSRNRMDSQFEMMDVNVQNTLWDIGKNAWAC